jgi:hypothetical protein
MTYVKEVPYFFSVQLVNYFEYFLLQERVIDFCNVINNVVNNRNLTYGQI